jgi:hypothetical protein
LTPAPVCFAELDAGRIAGHANATVIMRLYVRDERNQEAVHADVLGRAAAAGFAA